VRKTTTAQSSSTSNGPEAWNEMESAEHVPDQSTKLEEKAKTGIM